MTMRDVMRASAQLAVGRGGSPTEEHALRLGSLRFGFPGAREPGPRRRLARQGQSIAGCAFEPGDRIGRAGAAPTARRRGHRMRDASSYRCSAALRPRGRSRQRSSWFDLPEAFRVCDAQNELPFRPPLQSSMKGLIKA
jgi:hypothetical protein